jgi:hypothetical protein
MKADGMSDDNAVYTGSTPAVRTDAVTMVLL